MIVQKVSEKVMKANKMRTTHQGLNKPIVGTLLL